jgi:membrane associated rhomboid family serine protease
VAAQVIMAVTLVLSLIGFTSPSIIQRNLFRPYWFLPRREYATVITSGFVHANAGHLLFNLLTYYFFAFNLQRAIGPERFTALYVFGLLLSNAGTYFKHRREPQYACLGASGAILAVMFAGIVYFPLNRIALMFIPLPIPAPLFAVLYLGYTYYLAQQERGNINHDAHFDGALAGLAFVAITDPAAWVRAWRLVIG